MRTLPLEYHFLTPFKSSNLLRLGIEKDGGYIVDQKILKNSDFLISFGMADEYSFEIDFLQFNKNNKLIIYDFSISHFHYFKEIIKNLRRIIKFKRTLKDLSTCINNYIQFIKFTNLKKVNFFSKKITPNDNSKNNISIHKIFDKYLRQNKKNITLKIDIEGTEYEIINEILKYHEIIDQIIIEYHDTHIRKKEFLDNMRKYLNKFNITHLHANNYQSCNSDGFPINIEITFVNKKLIDNSYKKHFNFPIYKLDYPNNPKLKDLEFSFDEN